MSPGAVQEMAAGREGKRLEAPVGVIDIGSNSVRLVVFEGPVRAPVAKFNEKVLCGLGRGLSDSGRLDAEGVETSLLALRRFVALAKRMGVGDLRAVATAAVRDAANGAEFVALAQRQCGLSIRVLAGDEEARFSAQGVVSGIPEADGVMGDLGGGSLELVTLEKGQPGEGLTLPLGPFRLAGLSLEAAQSEIDRALAAVPWLKARRGRSLYLVGGAWRAMARIHMAQTNYPLHIIHHYRLGPAEADEITRLLARQGRESLSRLAGVPRRRLDTLPLAALVLRRLLKRAAPREIVFSAHGLREGMIYAALPETVRAEDPLLAAARDMAWAEGRFGEHGSELYAFTEPLFAGEDDACARLRQAACVLADTAWRVSPDYRGEQAFRRILHAPFGGIDHPGRAALALAVFVRYEGAVQEAVEAEVHGLIDPQAVGRALRLGLALRLANSLSGGAAGVLGEFNLVTEPRKLVLEATDVATDLLGEAVARQHEALARHLGLTAEFRRRAP